MADKRGSASRLIDRRIKKRGDWRGERLRRFREIIKDADPAIIEEWKWRVPVWSHNSIVCTGESDKNVVKPTFARGASLKDPSRLFNPSFEGKIRRAIDIHEGDLVEARIAAWVKRAAAKPGWGGLSRTGG